jgi:hypothetical protein
MWFVRLRKKKKPSCYEGFEYSADQLSAYLNTGFGFFMLSLKNGDIVRYQPDDVEQFCRWLTEQKIRNVRVG